MCVLHVHVRATLHVAVPMRSMYMCVYMRMYVCVKLGNMPATCFSAGFFSAAFFAAFSAGFSAAFFALEGLGFALFFLPFFLSAGDVTGRFVAAFLEFSLSTSPAART